MGYYKQCRYCEDDIYLEQDDDKWKAWNDDFCRDLHNCRQPSEIDVECKWCGEDIVLRQLTNGKWTPTETNGLQHFCNRSRRK